MKSFGELLNEIIKSKRFWTMVGWCGYLAYTASQAPSEYAVDIIRSASFVVCAWLASQAVKDFALVWVGNGSK